MKKYVLLSLDNLGNHPEAEDFSSREEAERVMIDRVSMDLRHAEGQNTPEAEVTDNQVRITFPDGDRICYYILEVEF